MAKKLIRSWLPRPERIRQIKVLGHLGPRLHDPAIWHLNRRSAAGAFAISLFVMVQPIPMQMLAAGLLAVLLRSNLPLTVSLVWISNPLTSGPIWYLSYRIGAWLLDSTPVSFSLRFDQWHDLLELSGNIFKPLLLGGLIGGTLCSLAGYLSINLLWRLSVAREWKKRRCQRIKRRRSLALKQRAPGPVPVPDA